MGGRGKILMDEIRHGRPLAVDPDAQSASPQRSLPARISDKGEIVRAFPISLKMRIGANRSLAPCLFHRRNVFIRHDCPSDARVNVPRSASLSYRCVVGCQFLGIACTQ
jgi:hypothetical protein